MAYGDNLDLNILAHQYNQGFLFASQQQKSALEAAVMNEDVTGDYWFKDVMTKGTGVTTISGVTTSTTQTDTAWTRRALYVTDYELSRVVSRLQELQTVNDPKSAIIQDHLFQFNRKKDSLIITNALGTVAGGLNGGSTFAFDGGSVVASGTTNLTEAKVIAANQKLLEAHVEAGRKKYFVIGAQQHSALLGINTFVSADYTVDKPLVDGGVTYWMGFYFIFSDQLPVSSSVRQCFAFSDDALVLGKGKDVRTSIERNQQFHYHHEVYTAMQLGATRLYEDRVIRIDCVET